MTPDILIRNAVRPALALLPAGMTSRPAVAMLVGIALQESGIQHRRQVGGPARGFWQFEVNGVRGVMAHPATAGHERNLRSALDYPPLVSSESVQGAIEHNDILAAGFARLLLWTLPGHLAREAEPGVGWSQYLAAWRPGRPRPDTWEANFRAGWEAAHRTQNPDSVVTWSYP